VGRKFVLVVHLDSRGCEALADYLCSVGAMLGQGLAGPLPADQDATPAKAEVCPVVCLGLAPAWSRVPRCVFGADAVEDPVSAGRRAGQDLYVSVKPVEVRELGGMNVRGVVAVGLSDGLPEVLRQVADRLTYFGF
jgi:hypothetical protein